MLRVAPRVGTMPETIGRDRPLASRSPEAVSSMGRHVRFLDSPHSCPGRSSPHPARPGGQEEFSMPKPPVFVGIDIAKGELVVAVRPTGEQWTTANTAAAGPTLVARLHALAPQLIVCEASGGYEIPVAGLLGAAALPIVVVNPRQVRDFAKA